MDSSVPKLILKVGVFFPLAHQVFEIKYFHFSLLFFQECLHNTDFTTPYNL